MAITVPKEQLFQNASVLLGGLGPTFEIAELTDEEKRLFDKFFNETAKRLQMVSPKIANIFVDHYNVILSFAKIFKAKVGEKSFSGEPVQPGSIGVSVLAPFDLHYTDNPSDQEPAFTAYGKYDWRISVTQGQPVYLLGDANHYFKTSPIVGKRALAVILQNGIIEIGTTPSINQFKVETEKSNYTPWRADTLYDQPIDPDRPIYVYRTPFVIPLWYDFGIRLKAMPVRSGTSDLRLLGVIFYESDYYSDLRG